MKPFAIVGGACSGKNTLAEHLEKVYDFPRIGTYTTRPRRPNEAEDAYNFVSEDKFNLMLKKGLFDEADRYRVATGETWWYGSILPYPNFERLAPKLCTIILTPSGVKKTIHQLEGIIYLYANPFIRLSRGLARGDDIVELTRRIGMEDDELKTFHFHMSNNRDVIRFWSFNTGDEGYSPDEVALKLQSLL